MEKPKMHDQTSSPCEASFLLLTAGETRAPPERWRSTKQPAGANCERIRSTLTASTLRAKHTGIILEYISPLTRRTLPSVMATRSPRGPFKAFRARGAQGLPAVFPNPPTMQSPHARRTCPKPNGTASYRGPTVRETKTLSTSSPDKNYTHHARLLCIIHVQKINPLRQPSWQS